MTSDLDHAAELYATYRRTGTSKAETKRRVYAQLPDFKATVNFGTSLAPRWARRLQKIENDLTRDNNGPTPDPTPSPNGSNGYSPTDDMLAYLTALDPADGDPFTLNLHYLAWKHKKANDAAWRYVFAENGSLARLGWCFEVLNNNGRCYQVRILAAASDRTAAPEIDQLMAEANALQEDLARLQQNIARSCKAIRPWPSKASSTVMQQDNDAPRSRPATARPSLRSASTPPAWRPATPCALGDNW